MRWRFAWAAVPVALFASPSLPAARPIHTARMHLSKASHELTVFVDDRPVGAFQASIGPGGPGVKRQEGDNVTPVGRYHVVGHQTSKFRIFLRLDYPNAEDRARFEASKARGELPAGARIGGDIGVHGTPQAHAYDAVRETLRGQDWTAGCIGLQDDEIDRVAAWVPDGSVIEIED